MFQIQHEKYDYKLWALINTIAALTSTVYDERAMRNKSTS